MVPSTKVLVEFIWPVGHLQVASNEIIERKTRREGDTRSVSEVDLNRGKPKRLQTDYDKPDPTGNSLANARSNLKGRPSLYMRVETKQNEDWARRVDS